MTGRFANPFIETFTRRELDILTLLAEGLTNQEIAQSGYRTRHSQVVQHPDLQQTAG